MADLPENAVVVVAPSPKWAEGEVLDASDFGSGAALSAFVELGRVMRVPPGFVPTGLTEVEIDGRKRLFGSKELADKAKTVAGGKPKAAPSSAQDDAGEATTPTVEEPPKKAPARKRASKKTTS